MRDSNTAFRTLKTSSAVAAFLTIWMLCAARNSWAWSFLIGATLSLLSMLSLSVLIPMLFHPGASRHAKALLLITLFMKMPLYCVGLFLLMIVPNASGLSAVFGIALVPFVITARAVGSLISENLPRTETSAADARVKERPRAAPAAQPVGEGG